MNEKELIRELALIAAGQKPAPDNHVMRNKIRTRGWGGWAFDRPNDYDASTDLKFYIFPEGWEALKKASEDSETPTI